MRRARRSLLIGLVLPLLAAGLASAQDEVAQDEEDRRRAELAASLAEQPRAPGRIAAACQALAEVATPRALPELLAALRWEPNARGVVRPDPREPARMAYERLARADPAAIDSALAEALAPGQALAIRQLEEAARARPRDAGLTLALLVRATRGRDEVERRLAARALGRALGPEAVPPLVKAINARTDFAVQALAELGCAEALPPLLEQLRRGRDDLGLVAAQGLLRFDPGRVLPALDPSHRGPGLELYLAELGPLAIPLLREWLDGRDIGRCRVAAGALAMRPDPAALQELVGALRHTDPPVRASAGQALLKLGPRAGPVSLELVQLLGASELAVDTRLVVAEVLAAIGPSAREAALGRPELLQDPDPLLRAAGARALAAVAPVASSALATALVEALELGHRDERTRKLVLAGLRSLSPQACAPLGGRLLRLGEGEMLLAVAGASALPAALEDLRAREAGTRRAAASFLARLAAQAPEAAVALVPALADEDPGVRLQAQKGLAAAGDLPPGVPLEALLEDPGGRGSWAPERLRLLGRLGPAGVEHLERMLLATDPTVDPAGRAALLTALAGAAPERALPALREHLVSQDARLRQQAREAVAAVGSALPLELAVQAAQVDPSQLDLTSRASEVLPALLAAADESVQRDRRARHNALLAAARLGPAGVEAVLERFLTGGPQALTEARSALAQVRPLAAGPLARALVRARDRAQVQLLLSLLGGAQAEGEEREGTVLLIAVLETLARGDPDPVVSESATVALGRLGASACPALLRVVRGAPGRETASRLLRAQSQGTPELLLALVADPAPDVRVTGLAGLAELAARTPWPELGAEVLASGLADADATVKVSALQGLARLRGGEAHVDQVARLIRDEDLGVSRAAARLLAQIGPRTPAAEEALRSALADELLGGEVARPLRNAPGGLGLLRAALGAESAPLRIRAAEVLGDEGAPVVGTILRAEQDPALRLEAARALERIGRAATSQGEALLGAMAFDQDPEVRAAAARTLGSLGLVADTAQAGLARALADPDARVRQEATRALMRARELAPATVQALVRVAREDAEAPNRVLAIQSLGRVRADPEVRAALEKAAQLDPDPGVQANARRLLR